MCASRCFLKLLPPLFTQLAIRPIPPPVPRRRSDGGNDDRLQWLWVRDCWKDEGLRAVLPGKPPYLARITRQSQRDRKPGEGFLARKGGASGECDSCKDYLRRPPY